jgi:hypothetical protein
VGKKEESWEGSGKKEALFCGQEIFCFIRTVEMYKTGIDFSMPSEKFEKVCLLVLLCLFIHM